MRTIKPIFWISVTWAFICAFFWSFSFLDEFDTDYTYRNENPLFIDYYDFNGDHYLSFGINIIRNFEQKDSDFIFENHTFHTLVQDRYFITLDFQSNTYTFTDQKYTYTGDDEEKLIKSKNSVFTGDLIIKGRVIYFNIPDYSPLKSIRQKSNIIPALVFLDEDPFDIQRETTHFKLHFLGDKKIKGYDEKRFFDFHKTKQN